MKTIVESLRDTIELRQGGVVLEQEIRAMGRTLNRVERSTANRPASQRMQDLADWIHTDLPTMRVEDAMAERGVAYLRKLLTKRTKDGELVLRQTTLANDIVEDSFVLHVLQYFDHFMLEGFEWEGSGYNGRWFPRYSVQAIDEQYFEYTAIPWQTGSPIFHI